VQSASNRLNDYEQQNQRVVQINDLCCILKKKKKKKKKIFNVYIIFIDCFKFNFKYNLFIFYTSFYKFYKYKYCI